MKKHLTLGEVRQELVRAYLVEQYNEKEDVYEIIPDELCSDDLWVESIILEDDMDIVIIY